MPILTFPDIVPSRSTWGIRSLTETFASPLNGAVQTVSRPGSRWKANLDFNMLSLAQGAKLEAWLAQMDGMAGRCYVYPHHRPGTGANATVNGAGQVGTTLNISCADGRIFSMGDYFTVNGEFKIVAAPVTANGAGQVALPFAPMLRGAPVNGAVLTFTSPTALMMLAQDEFSMPRIGGPRYDPVSIPLIEVFA